MSPQKEILTSLCFRSALRTILEIGRLVSVSVGYIIANVNSLLGNTGVLQNVLTDICVHLKDSLGFRSRPGI